MRSTWKGHIRLGLVAVPVKAFAAHSSASEMHLNQLHADCHCRILYKKCCPKHGEVPASEIVSGYEVAKDRYVTIEPEELDAMRPESDKAVVVEGLMDADTLDPRCYNGKTYYLTPDGVVGDRPYALLRVALTLRGQALCQVVMNGKRQLLLLRPIGEKLIAMTMLQYSAEVKGLEDFEREVKDIKPEPAELALLGQLLDHLPVLNEAHWEEMEDDYTEQLTKLIEAKTNGREVETPSEESQPVLSLMEALKQSVAKAMAS